MTTAEQAYKMLGNENLWEVAQQCHRALSEAEILHSICGGVAVCLHGYQRNTTDLDLIVQSPDSDKIRATFQELGLTWSEEQAEFQSPSGISVQFLYSGERAGNGSPVLLPEPSGDLNVEEVEGLPVLRLSKLIEIKIACGEGNVRRTHKDLADVVELIAIRNLDASFARFLHKSVRNTFKQLVQNARSE